MKAEVLMKFVASITGIEAGGAIRTRSLRKDGSVRPSATDTIARLASPMRICRFMSASLGCFSPDIRYGYGSTVTVTCHTVNTWDMSWLVSRRSSILTKKE